MGEKPSARGLFVCEKVIVEEGTHNLTLVNCFNLRRVEKLPVEVPLTIAAMLTNGSGAVNLFVVIRRLEDEVSVYQRTFSLAFPNPLTVVQFVLNLRPEFVHAGGHEVELSAGGESLAATRFDVKLLGGQS